MTPAKYRCEACRFGAHTECRDYDCECGLRGVHPEPGCATSQHTLEIDLDGIRARAGDDMVTGEWITLASADRVALLAEVDRLRALDDRQGAELHGGPGSTGGAEGWIGRAVAAETEIERLRNYIDGQEERYAKLDNETWNYLERANRAETEVDRLRGIERLALEDASDLLAEAWWQGYYATRGAPNPFVKCHCDQPAYTHPDGFTRGLCSDCDAERCDAPEEGARYSCQDWRAQQLPVGVRHPCRTRPWRD